MAQVLSLGAPAAPTLHRPSSARRWSSPRTQISTVAGRPCVHHQSWTSLQNDLKCRARFSCLFSNNRKQEEARKALESALGEKKTEFERWDKEIKKREEASGGGDGGGGGWFRWGRWSGGSNDDHFWQEAQQLSLTIVGILVMYLVIAKGDVLLAVIFNPMLFGLRGIRIGLIVVTSQILRKFSPTTHANFGDSLKQEAYTSSSAKESVVRKWGSD
ncbi:hypothetical protein RJ639_030902 [Escallonia herrerae]|uniref:Uncharacterized protein n=1 Tax=Escallonia herrerae TaxID=1293975 RepID=A0AA88WZS4_9ASTE|nr:hypothetical protein RJ639_030902 [Escallonia herrerae]